MTISVYVELVQLSIVNGPSRAVCAKASRLVPVLRESGFHRIGGNAVWEAPAHQKADELLERAHVGDGFAPQKLCGATPVLIIGKEGVGVIGKLRGVGTLAAQLLLDLATPPSAAKPLSYEVAHIALLVEKARGAGALDRLIDGRRRIPAARELVARLALPVVALSEHLDERRIANASPYGIYPIDEPPDIARKIGRFLGDGTGNPRGNVHRPLISRGQGAHHSCLGPALPIRRCGALGTIGIDEGDILYLRRHGGLALDADRIEGVAHRLIGKLETAGNANLALDLI